MSLRIFRYFAIVVLLAGFAGAQPVAEPQLRLLVEARLSEKTPDSRALKFSEFCPVDSSVVADRVFREYGSVFAADRTVALPRLCIFPSEQEVSKFQAPLVTRSERIGGFEIELQEAAMDALMEAVRQAEHRGLRITPLDGSIAGKRSFADTERIWRSRFLPALSQWVARGKISMDDADTARALPILPQVERVFAWESQGYYFSTSKNRPIMSSVAPPGASQHLFLLAFDIEQSGSRAVREILNRNGWYQTVVGDSPHFTYLGVPESKLPERGLKLVFSGGTGYWAPRVSSPKAVRPGRVPEVR